MISNDQEIKEFFREMKAHDERLTIPSPSGFRHSKFKWWLPLGIAASISVLMTIHLLSSKSQTIKDSTLEISLAGHPTNITQSLTDQASSLEAWESPTQSLIDDF